MAPSRMMTSTTNLIRIQRDLKDQVNGEYVRILRDMCRSPGVVRALKHVNYTAWQWWRKHKTTQNFVPETTRKAYV
jgi:hypothetical protein